MAQKEKIKVKISFYKEGEDGYIFTVNYFKDDRIPLSVAEDALEATEETIKLGLLEKDPRGVWKYDAPFQGLYVSLTDSKGENESEEIDITKIRNEDVLTVDIYLKNCKGNQNEAFSRASTLIEKFISLLK